MKYIIISIMLLLCIGALVYGEIRVMFLNNRANRFFTKNEFTKAKTLYKKAQDTSKHIGYVPQGNLSALEYMEGEYVDAQKLLDKALQKGCIQSKNKTATSTKLRNTKQCATLSYNMGNVLYRLGEQIGTKTASSTSSEQQKRDVLWASAIRSYQNTLGILPDDTFAKENIDFIMKKLDKNTEHKEDKDSEKNKDKNNNSEKTGGDKSKKGEQDNQNNSKQDNSEGQTQENKSNGTAGGDSSNSAQEYTKLSKQASDEIERYMQQVDQQNYKLQKYFRQDPMVQQSKNNNSIFNDPFFDDFFKGTPFEVQFSKNSQESIIDW